MADAFPHIKYREQLIYDPAGTPAVQGDAATKSIIIHQPIILLFDGTRGTDTIAVNVKWSRYSGHGIDWVVDTGAAALATSVDEWEMTRFDYAFVQIVRSGTEDFTAYAVMAR